VSRKIYRQAYINPRGIYVQSKYMETQASRNAGSRQREKLYEAAGGGRWQVCSSGRQTVTQCCPGRDQVAGKSTRQ